MLAELSGRRYLYMADEELISLVEVGDPGALTVLYDRHSRPAFSLAYRMMREWPAAEDLVQDSFLKVWRFAGNYRVERGSTRTWILSIVHNQGIDRLRWEATRQGARERFEALATKTQSSEAFEYTWSSIGQSGLREALKTLPVEQLEIMELAYFQDRTHREIAQLLELPLGTVKGRMRLGLKRLRGCFKTPGCAGVD